MSLISCEAGVVWPLPCRPAWLTDADTPEPALLRAGIPSQHSAQLHGHVGSVWSQPALGSSHHSQLGARVAQTPPCSTACGNTIPGFACPIPYCLLVLPNFGKIPVCKLTQSCMSSKTYFCLLCSLQYRGWGVAFCSKHLK